MTALPTRVLVIDDDLIVRAVVRETLRIHGSVVEEAPDGRVGLERFGQVSPDVVLLDVELPGLSGFEVLERLRERPGGDEVPVIFLTGRVDSEVAARAVAAGAHDYLKKPFEPSELLARVAAAARLNHTTTDELTGLHNRRHLDPQLQQLLDRSRRDSTPLTVAIADVDDLEAVNDRCGRAAGDDVLREIAARLNRVVRAEDVLGRWGGDEFLVLAPDTGPSGMWALAERLRRHAASTPIAVDGGTELSVTISLGWAAWHDGDTGHALLARADRALSLANFDGRNLVRSGETAAAPPQRS
jgi:two-component system cell cycle response regulator